MIEISLNKNEEQIEPIIKWQGKNEWSITDIATIIFYLHSGAYTTKLYEDVYDKLSPEKLAKLNAKLSGMLATINESVDGISERAELDSAKLPVISSEVLPEEPYEH
jgi:hypothetical protein